MKPGPKRTPTQTLKLRGSWLAKSREEPPVKPSRLQPPRWLSTKAQRQFHELADVLHARGVTGPGDEIGLALLAKAIIDYQRVDAIVTGEGEIVTTKSGMKRPHPAVGMRAALADQIRKGLADHGLTPADRSRVSAVPGGDSVASIIAANRHLIDQFKTKEHA